MVSERTFPTGGNRPCVAVRYGVCETPSGTRRVDPAASLWIISRSVQRGNQAVPLTPANNRIIPFNIVTVPGAAAAEALALQADFTFVARV
jgi:hypothetical protein